ncbi:MAG: YceI family protein [Ferruginibacter sp.]
MKGDKFPAITFLLTTPVTNVPSGANGYTVTAKGNLTIAGVTKAVSIPIKISEDAQQKILIEGSSPVKMTDYGIDPPTALFGMLKTANDITISFNTTFLSSTN